MISDPSFTLAHLSDPHLAYHHGLRWVDLFNKRLFGYMKWRLKRSSEHHADVLNDLIDDIRANRPDHIVVTGDLTHLGLPAESVKAKELLKAIGAPSQITVIPGNHDAYVASALNGCLTHWAEYIVSDQTAIHPGEPVSTDALFPTLRIRGPLAIIGICSARPCSTFLAVGSIGSNQLQRFRKLLIETGQQGLFRVVLIHHPPVAGIVSWRKRLTDAKAFRNIVKQYGADLILHGHAHHRSHAQLRTTDGYVPVIGISAASAAGENIGRRARYHLYHLLPKADGWDIRVCVRSYANKDKCFATEDEYRLSA